MNTTLLLAIRFNGPTVALKDICDEFFGMGESMANLKARRGELPVPAAQLSGSQKAPYVVSVADLAKLIDDRFKEARAAHTGSV